MNRNGLTLAALALTLLGCGAEAGTTAPEGTVETPAGETVEQPKALPAGFLGNTTCPFSGQQVDPDSFYEHHGEKIYFCNPQCAIDGAKEPDKYRNQVYGNPKPVGNTICPVNGEEIVDAIPASWQGHKVSLCCTFCISGFEGDPEAFVLAAMESVDG